MLEKVKDYVEKWQMLTSEDCVIAGVSGGADSVCLLFVLLELQKEIDFRIVVAHVNHGLRGQAADADENYVKQLCKEHGIPCESYFANVELIAKKRKQSTEEAGREVRKEFFAEVLHKYHGTKIALAHHQNDSAETFLFNLARGTGLKGLGGIAPVNENVIRPLLCVNRAQIEAYLESANISYCTDQTNASDAYARNRIRNHVLPYMEEEINAKTVQHMNETMEQIRMVSEFLEEQTLKIWQVGAKATETGYIISEEAYRGAAEVLKPLLIKKALVAVSGHEKDIEAVHVRQIQTLMEKQTGRRVNLPYQMEGRRVYEGVEICLKNEKPAADTCEISYDMQEQEAVFQYEDKTIRCQILERREAESKSFEKSRTKRFDCDIIEGGISFRTRREGDYITIHPDGRTQKLKSYFINEKIPAKERDQILLVANGNHILWVVGYRMGCAYQIKADTKRVLEIQIDEGESYGRDN